MEHDPRADLLKRLESGYFLPALSVVAIKLMELASDETCSVNDLVALIEKDPSLVIRLLKVANSAFFGAGHQTTTLRQAIVRIGFHQLRIMALSLSLRDTFPMGKIGSFDYETFWRVSLYRSLMAKSLAERLRTGNSEEAFVAGLTLGVGFLIFFDIFVKSKGVEISPKPGGLEELLEWEKTRFGVHHREIGEAALRYWKFPEPIIACQHGYLVVPETPVLSKICELARRLSNNILRRSTDFQDLFQDARKSFGLDEEAINTVILTSFEEVEGIAANLKIEMDKEKDLLELMEKANRALSKISEKISALQYGSPNPIGTLPSFATLREEVEGKDYVAHTLQAVAHEIRNPLVAVAGFARRLSGTLDPSSKGGRYAQIILDEARRLEEALGQMTG